MGFRSHDVEAIVGMHGAAASLRLIDDLTAHGFRATPNLVGDRPSFLNEIVEAAPAQIVGDKVEQAGTATYLRNDAV
jgi:hypothetical protein